MFKSKSRLVTSALISAVLFSSIAQADSKSDIEFLKAEIQRMKSNYESKINNLESKIQQIESSQSVANNANGLLIVDNSGAVISSPQKSNDPTVSDDPTNIARNLPTPATVRRAIRDNRFNPSFGVILNGQYSNFSSAESEIKGFALGHEGERPDEGFAVDHSEINVSANVDDKFFGSLTAAIAEHDGETELELEEAFVQTLPGFGLPSGFIAKAGRAFWTLGYLNEHHDHVDDFADRPLPYRAFLDNGYNDDGAEFSYLLPTDFYSEIGGGVFRGEDYPFGGNEGKDIGAFSAYARVGGDISQNHNFRVGAYLLSGDIGERVSNDDELVFRGESDMYIADIRYTWAPTGNPRQQEVILQGEYFWRTEDGTYEDTAATTGQVAYDESTSGWYAQGVYKFHPNWRVGARYSELNSSDVPLALQNSIIDAEGHDPKSYTAMMDYTNSEFSRVRLQYNNEELIKGQKDDQFIVQYIMSIGAHGAHKY